MSCHYLGIRSYKSQLLPVPTMNPPRHSPVVVSSRVGAVGAAQAEITTEVTNRAA